MAPRIEIHCPSTTSTGPGPSNANATTRQQIQIQTQPQNRPTSMVTLDASSQNKQVGSVLRRQVGLLAGKTAKRRLTELRNTSRLPRAQHDFLSEHDEHYPCNDTEFDNLHKPMRLSWDEIFVEDMLGMGGFGSVCLVTCPKLRKQREREERKAASRRSGNLDGNGCDDSSFGGSMMMSYADDSSFGGSMMLSYASTTTATGYERTLDPNKYYACKSLSNKTIKQANVRGFIQAAADLVHEAFLLSHINPHPNLVRLYGVPDGDIETAFHCGDDNLDGDNLDGDGDGDSDLGYFLILEALGGGILSDKVYDWKQKQSNLLREQQILKKRKEQQQQQQQQLQEDGRSSPTLGSFLGSSMEQKKSHAGRRASLNSKDPTIVGTGNPLNYQLPSLEERLDIALQIASGMQHLHNHGIVFRDLKPHNVGLSVSTTSSQGQGQSPAAATGDQQLPQQHTQLTWRLFDFGLAREVPVSARASMPNTMPNTIPHSTLRGGGSKFYGGTHHHSVTSDPSVCYGKAGSLRYMAPETMGGRWLRSSKHHNSCCFATFGSDVYAFAIVLWELVGLQNFDKKHDSSPEDFESAVCDRGHRPGMEALDKAIEMDKDHGTEPASEAQAAAQRCRHGNIRELVHACWREDYRQRPTFDFIVATLKEMLPSETEPETDNSNSNTNEDDDNTVATDNLNEEVQQLSMGMGPPPNRDPRSEREQHGLRVSNHSYRSGKSNSQRSNSFSRRRLMKRRSSRSVLSGSNHSMTTHSMVLEDVFELDTEHSHSTGSKNSNHRHRDNDHDLDSDLDNDNDNDDDDQSMAQHSMTSLMNESVITIDNKKEGGSSSSSRYLDYGARYNDENGSSEIERDPQTQTECSSVSSMLLDNTLNSSFGSSLKISPGKKHKKKAKKSRKSRSSH